MRDLASPAGSGRPPCRASACARSRRSPAARGGRARRRTPCPSPRASCARRAGARARRRGGPRAAATRRRPGASGRASRSHASGAGTVARSPPGSAPRRPLPRRAARRCAHGSRAPAPLPLASADLAEVRERDGAALGLAAARCGLDELGQPPERQPQRARIRHGPLAGGQGLLVAAEAVVAHGVAPGVGDQHEPPRPGAARPAGSRPSASGPRRPGRTSSRASSAARGVRWLPVASTTAATSAASDIAIAILPENSSTRSRSVRATGSSERAPTRRASSS